MYNHWCFRKFSGFTHFGINEQKHVPNNYDEYNSQVIDNLYAQFVDIVSPEALLSTL